MKKYVWKQADGKLWDVKTDSDKGIIVVTDENDKLVTGKTKLSSDAVKLIEDNFFSVVATELTPYNKETIKYENSDPMFA